MYALSQSLKRITPNPKRPSKYDATVMSTQKGRTGMMSFWSLGGRNDGTLFDFNAETPRPLRLPRNLEGKD